MKSKTFSISTDKDGASDRTKIVILQAVGGQDMVDLVEMVEKVQLEAVVAYLENWTVMVNAKTRTQAIDNISGQENQTMSRLKPFQQIAKGELSSSSKDEGLCLVRE